MMRKAKLPQGLQPVCIVWRDAHDGDEGIEDAETLLEKASFATVHTFGLFAGKNDEVHVLMQDYCATPAPLQGLRGHYMIPNECVIRVIPLIEKPPKTRKRPKNAVPKKNELLPQEEEEVPTVSQENGWAYSEAEGIAVSKDIYDEAKRQEVLIREKIVEDINRNIFGESLCTDSQPPSPDSP